MNFFNTDAEQKQYWRFWRKKYFTGAIASGGGAETEAETIKNICPEAEAEAINWVGEHTGQE